MGSSNRHWPGFFKSNPSCSAPHHHQRHHDINRSSQLVSGLCQKPCSYTSGAEEKTPEPKPRWNPKPEQIRILESIFNSGMVNPPRDEICRIRDQLQVYGQVGDANVFYWFQNRKSRSKHKQRHLKSAAARSITKPCSAASVPPTAPVAPPPSATTSSSSSSDRSSSGSDMLTLPAFFDLPESLAPPLLNPELGLGSSVFLPAISSTYPTPSGETAAGSIDAGIPSLWSGLIMQGFSRKKGVGEEELGMLAILGSVADAALLPPASIASNYMASVMAAPSTFNEMEVSRSTVFIDEVAYEVMAGPLNIREAFGENAILVHSSGHPVLTDERGLTLHPLQHGSSYYLVQ